MFSCTKEAYATKSGKETSDLFQLVLYADDSLKASQSKVDLSGIKIDVYSSELTDYNAEANGSTFTHNEAFSVYTDAEGKVQFSRPSEE